MRILNSLSANRRQPPFGFAADGLADDRPILLAAGMRIVGDVVSTRPVEISGELVGTVRAPRILVHPGGKMDGVIIAETIDCAGELDEVVAFAGTLQLRATANVAGIVVCRNLILHRGAYFEGQSRFHPNAIDLEVGNDRRQAASVARNIGTSGRVTVAG